MITKVFHYVQKHHMIQEGDAIVAGISGGADSVCLLFMLFEIRKSIPFTLTVVHVNHGIRKEAKEDADYVEKLCKEHEIPFVLVEKNIRAYAEENKLSEEEAGRHVRYEAFADALQGVTGKIAVAHNANDRAETMLFHLFRGTGLTGASGIKPINEKIIRPLLCLERTEIEAWLKERGIRYCQDKTNEQDTYTRNRIRHHILPYAEEEVCKGAIRHMNQAADQLLLAETYIQKQIAEAKKRCTFLEETNQGTAVKIKLTEYRKEDVYLQERILLSCLEELSIGRKNITAAHVGNIQKLFQIPGSGQIQLPHSICVYKEYDLGMIYKEYKSCENNKEKEIVNYRIEIPGMVEVPGLGKVEFTVFPYEKTVNIPQKTYTKWFDYDKITKSMLFRTRKSGDYLTINSKMSRKSLQDYFINEKIPKTERDYLYVLAEDAHIMWIPGYRISEYYKVTEETSRILEVTVADKNT